MLYAGGYFAQLAGNYAAWQRAGGFPGDGTSPELPSTSPMDCFIAAFTFPYGVIGIAICAGLLGLLIVAVMKMGWGGRGEYDRERNLIYSNKGTYGTADFMSVREMDGVLDLVPDVRKHSGTI